MKKSGLISTAQLNYMIKMFMQNGFGSTQFLPILIFTPFYDSENMSPTHYIASK